MSFACSTNLPMRVGKMDQNILLAGITNLTAAGCFIPLAGIVKIITMKLCS